MNNQEYKMKPSLVGYLSAYHGDLEYQFHQEGHEYMNNCSSGTEEHMDDEEAKKYLADLAGFISNLTHLRLAILKETA